MGAGRNRAQSSRWGCLLACTVQAAVMSLRVLGFNPLAATGLRLDEIVGEAGNCDFILLAGTQSMSRYSEQKVLRGRSMGRMVLEAPAT
eukprot:5609624-Pyramimonas_sp.AAC.1